MCQKARELIEERPFPASREIAMPGHDDSPHRLARAPDRSCRYAKEKARPKPGFSQSPEAMD
jgi:hypothetical protein